MAEFYSNLPPKDKDRLQQTIDKLTSTAYQEEFQFNLVPKWLRITMIILKGSMVLIPFIISSIAMFYESDMNIMESGLWKCIWVMSLLHILNYADEK